MIPREISVVLREIWPMLLLFIIVLSTLRIIDSILNKKKMLLYKDLLTLVFILYMFLLFELVTTTDFESYSNNFIPLKEIIRYNYTSSLFFKNVIGNVLLFIPFGYFVNYFLKNKKIYITIISTLITSLSIEIIQMNIGRSFDIDDIILNLCGSVIGCLLFRLSIILSKKIPKALKKEWIYNLIWIIAVSCSVIFIFNYYKLWR